jgi:hypothetical protein
MIHMIRETTTDPISAGTNPVIVKPVITNDANQKNNALSIIPNNPSVKIFTGNVSNEITGLINVLISPIIKATNNAVKNELTLIPETKYEVASTAQVNANHFNNILIINK